MSELNGSAAIRSSHTMTVVMDNTRTSSFACLLACLDSMIAVCEEQDYYPLAINHKMDLFNLRKELFGY